MMVEEITPVSDTSMKAAIRRVISCANLSNVSDADISDIVHQSYGDMRNAINTLQFIFSQSKKKNVLSVMHDDDFEMEFIKSSSKSKKSKKSNGNEVSREVRSSHEPPKGWVIPEGWEIVEVIRNSGKSKMYISPDKSKKCYSKPVSTPLLYLHFMYSY